MTIPASLQHFWMGMFYTCDGCDPVDANHPQMLRVHIAQPDRSKSNRGDERKIKEAQEVRDALNHLTALIKIGSEDNVGETEFTVVNGGDIAITKHTIFCHVNDMAFAGSLFIQNSHLHPIAFQEGPLGPGGDGETVQCLKIVKVMPPLACADVQLVVRFSIFTQPKKELEKAFRFATKRSSSGMTWNIQPLYAPVDYCSNDMQQ